MFTKYHIQEYPFKIKEKTIFFTLMNYTQMDFTNMKDKVMRKSVSTVYILIRNLIVFQIGIFWVVA